MRPQATIEIHSSSDSAAWARASGGAGRCTSHAATLRYALSGAGQQRQFELEGGVGYEIQRLGGKQQQAGRDYQQQAGQRPAQQVPAQCLDRERAGAAQHAQVEQRSGVPTMSDVAKLAGVSPMTVSRVMNGDTKVRQSTRRKVDEAVAALNYVPNQAARRLAGSRPIRIGFLYSNPSAGYLSEFLVGLLNQASLNNVQLVVEKCEAGEHWKEQTQRLIDNGVDGIILPPPLCDMPGLIDMIAKSSLPAVT
eukprot:gene25657-32136_t